MSFNFRNNYISKQILLVFIAASSIINLYTFQLFSQSTQTCYTTPGFYYFTPPSSCGSVIGTPIGIESQAWGAGGGGGGNTGGNNAAGGGGGGASTLGFNYMLVGTTYTIYVGNGGSGNGSNGLDGLDGEASYIIGPSGKLLEAEGGKGGKSYGNGFAGGLGGSIAASIGDVKFSGGNGGVGNTGPWGQSGGGGTSAGYGANGIVGGTGDYNNCDCPAPSIQAPAGGGDGGRGASGGGGGARTATGGSSPGGGGGGGANGAYVNGGKGGDGKVCVSWAPDRQFYIPTTWVAPSYISRIQVEAWGSGAGGFRGGNGGGGGAYALSTLDIMPGASYSVNPGSPGAMGANGNSSWFSLTGVQPTNTAEGVLAGGGVGSNGGSVEQIQ